MGSLAAPESTASSVQSAESFAELTSPFRRELLAHSYRMLGSIDDAEDAVQETLARAWLGRATFTRAISFRAWLYRIVTNTCLDHLRRRNSRPEEQSPDPNAYMHVDSPSGDILDQQAQPAADSNPERRLMGMEISQRIGNALEQLSPRERMVFEMKHYQGLKLRVIGDALGTSEETVKNSLFRAMRKLRGQLGDLL
jgi:RNA polymerase sigma-70 factor (ECF subfamily)